MAGAAKRRAARAQFDKNKGSSSSGSSGNPSDGTGRSLPKSITRLDGNRDPTTVTNKGRNAIDYSRPQDLKNISEALGFAGWCVARGVSTNALSIIGPRTLCILSLPRTGYMQDYQTPCNRKGRFELVPV